MHRNTHFDELKKQYLFAEVASRAAAYQAQHPQERLLRLGVGDVSLPLPKPVIEAMHTAVEELAHPDSFRGYGPEEGYAWLKQTILDNDYTPRGIDLALEEVFISEGAGSDLGNLSELFTSANTVAIQDPSYPAYVDSSMMAGRKIVFLRAEAANGFVPHLPDQPVDIIYLCFPNNPTGVVLTREQLEQWVQYALRHKAIIIYDVAYRAFIASPDIPRSIYEIPGAKEVAIEVASFSKSAGFTAVRCGYTIVPRQTGLQAMWLRRQCTKYNGTSYIAQRAAQAVYTPEGQQGVRANIAYYMQTAKQIREGLQEVGLEVFGGRNAPYIWARAMHGQSSWQFFETLLRTCQVVCTPGVGFGPAGEGFVRFSAFSKREDCIEALKRIKERL